jgi:colanic acid/amylovoran biosynthesis glycosyltransferase
LHKHETGAEIRMSNSGLPRIGYLLWKYPRFSQTFIVNEILELERQGVELRIGSLRSPSDGVFHEAISRVKARCDYLPDRMAGGWAKARAAVLECARTDAAGFRSALACVIRHRDVTWFDFVQAALVRRWAGKHRLSHLHVHFGTSEATVAWLCSLLGGPTYSLTLHAFDIFRDNVNRRLLAQKINCSRFTVTVCESNRQFMIENLLGVNAAKIRVNYNGIDLEQFSGGERLREPLSIFSVGRLIEKKGFIHLIRAVARLRDSGIDADCRIAGDGPEEHALQAEIARLNLKSHVHLLGPLRQNQVRAHLQRSSCFVLPCVQARDGNVDALPTVLLEALACECPAISTRLSGIPEIIDEGTSGQLVEPGDEPALAFAIRSVLTNDGLAQRLALGGRRRAEERFDIRRSVATMRAWLLDEPLRGADVSPLGGAIRPSEPPTAFDLERRQGELLGAREAG